MELARTRKAINWGPKVQATFVVFSLQRIFQTLSDCGPGEISRWQFWWSAERAT